MPKLPPPQRAVTVYRPGLRASGTLAVARKTLEARTRARTAGTPANSCARGNAREMIVTVLPTWQPPAVPRIKVVRPAFTVEGVSEREGTAASAEVIATSPATTTATGTRKRLFTVFSNRNANSKVPDTVLSKGQDRGPAPSRLLATGSP
jgi:hypothetical protein